jgi:hypothetical protein
MEPTGKRQSNVKNGAIQALHFSFSFHPSYLDAVSSCVPLVKLRASYPQPLPLLPWLQLLPLLQNPVWITLRLWGVARPKATRVALAL